MSNTVLERIRTALGIQTIHGLTERQIKLSAAILDGLGGKDNVTDYDACITRLRANVVDATKVDGALLNQVGARGLIVRDNFVQVVFGPHVAEIVSDLTHYIQEPVEIDYASVLKPRYTSRLETLDIIYAPFAGKVIPLSEVPNQEFASGLVGPGLAVELASSTVVSPVAGTVVAVFDQKHAIGLRTANGAELVVHVGLDTYQLDGVGFDPRVAKGDTVHVGDELMGVDLDSIKAAGGSLVSPVVITNWREAGDVRPIARADVRPGDGLFIVG